MLPWKNSDLFALCDVYGGRHQQPDVLEKYLNIFCFFIIFYVLVLLFSWRTVTPHGAMWLRWGSPATSCLWKQMATLTRPMPFGTAEGDKDCSDGQGVSLISMIFDKGPKHCCARPNMHIWHIWPYLAYLGAYLGARNMVKWGVPEKILQNAVQTRWS